MHKSIQTWSRGSVVVHNIVMGKKCGLSDFDRRVIVVARQDGLSISETTALLGFLCTTVS